MGRKEETIFVDFSRLLLTVPNLALHMNRDANDGVAVNAQTDMLPLITRITDQLSRENFFLEALAKEASVKKEDILDYEICIYCREPGTFQYRISTLSYDSPMVSGITSLLVSKGDSEVLFPFG
ncbi:MAG: hypothetical protein LBT06_16115 [Hungatella sp.]|nr:hypothetical protein [Hungatella sp.]